MRDLDDGIRALRPMSPKAKKLLWFDASAGCAVGCLILTLHPWLAALYGLPSELLLFTGAANLIYASYSGSLAWRATKQGRLSRLPVSILVWANAAWVAVCAAMVVATWRTSLPLGVVQMVGEGLFVGTLAVIEFRVVRPESGGGDRQ